VVAVDGFELAYDLTGSGPAAVLLHGWPGDRTDYRDLVPLLSGCRVLVPDLRGFGASDKHVVADPAEQYGGAAQARGVADLIDPLFPRDWSDRIDDFFSQARLRLVDGAGHYAPLEYPAVIAEEVHAFLADEVPGTDEGAW